MNNNQPTHQNNDKKKLTSVLIEPFLQKELAQRGMKLSFLVHNALDWKDRMDSQAKELLELRTKVFQQDLQIVRLHRENIDLLRLRVKALERLFGEDKK